MFEFAVYSSLLLLKKSFYAFFSTAVYLAFIPLVYYTTNKLLGGVSTTSPPRPGVYSGPGVKSRKYGNIPRISVPNSSILIKIFPRTHGPEVLLGRVFAAVGSVFNTGQQSNWQCDGTGSNGSFVPTRNEQVSVPINIIVLL